MLHDLIEEFEFAQINDLSATLVGEEPNQRKYLAFIPHSKKWFMGLVSIAQNQELFLHKKKVYVYTLWVYNLIW